MTSSPADLETRVMTNDTTKAQEHQEKTEKAAPQTTASPNQPQGLGPSRDADVRPFTPCPLCTGGCAACNYTHRVTPPTFRYVLYDVRGCEAHESGSGPAQGDTFGHATCSLEMAMYGQADRDIGVLYEGDAVVAVAVRKKRDVVVIEFVAGAA